MQNCRCSTFVYYYQTRDIDFSRLQLTYFRTSSNKNQWQNEKRWHISIFKSSWQVWRIPDISPLTANQVNCVVIYSSHVCVCPTYDNTCSYPHGKSLPLGSEVTLLLPSFTTTSPVLPFTKIRLGMPLTLKLVPADSCNDTMLLHRASIDTSSS